jgi:hypothetical protein
MDKAHLDPAVETVDEYNCSDLGQVEPTQWGIFRVLKLSMKSSNSLLPAVLRTVENLVHKGAS